MSEGGKDIKMSTADQQNEEEYKKYLDAEGAKLAKGPISDRSCTDIPMCLIFVVFIVGMFAAAYHGFKNGDPRKLIIGWDRDQNGCGYNETTLDYPYLYWSKAPDPAVVTKIKDAAKDPKKIKETIKDAMALLNDGVCVKECPKQDGPVNCSPTKAMKALPKFKTVNGKKVQQKEYYENCIYYMDTNKLASLFDAGSEQLKGLTSAIANKVPSQPFRYETQMVGVKDVAGFCLPSPDPKKPFISPEMTEQLKKVIMQSLGGDTVATYAKDVYIAWPIVAASVGVAFVIAVIYLILLQLIGGGMIWLSFILAIVGSAGGGFWVYRYAENMRKENPGDQFADYVTYGAYTAWGICGVILCIFCCCFSALRLGIAVFKATIAFTKANLTIFIQPVITLAFFIVWCLAWLVAVLWVMSIGRPAPREEFPFVTEVIWDDQTRYVFFYQVFGLFWMNAFIIGCCQFVIACAACIWFFQVKSDAIIKTPVLTSIKWVLTKHLGSIAFGALLIAICQFIRFLFEYYRKNIERWAGNNQVAKVILCITRYCLVCLEKCVKFLTKNAYIQVALTNTNFCSSAMKAFSLILTNARRFGAVGTIGSVYMIFGVFFIAGMNGLFCFGVLSQSPEAYAVSSPIPPTIVCGFIGVMVAYMFMSIFSFSSDAILQSFLLAESLKLPGTQIPDELGDFAAKLEGHSSCC